MQRDKNKYNLLVPSATLVPPELRVDFGEIPSAAISLGDGPVLKRIGENFPEAENKRIVTSQAGDSLARFTDENSDWSRTNLKSSRSLSETIVKGIQELTQEELQKPLFINFGDTVVTPKPIGTDTVYWGKADFPSRWTSFKTENNEIADISDKEENLEQSYTKVFCGLFRIDKPQRLRDCLKTSLDNSEGFYDALLRYIDGRDYQVQKAMDWFDAGHVDNYYRARRKNLNSRQFNNFQVNNRKATVTKKSEHEGKLKSELKWFQNLPTELRPYVPTLYSSEPDEFEMEMLDYPNLGEVLVYGSHPGQVWEKILSRLMEIHEDFREFERQDYREDALKTIYLEKTERRLDSIEKTGELSEFFSEGSITVNGREVASPRHIRDRLEEIKKSPLFTQPKDFTVIHGDFHLSNIVFDFKSNRFKLVDPRGEFGDSVLFGDPRYDMAKLRHSLLGGYDYVISDMFELHQNQNSFTYSIKNGERNEDFEEIFEKLNPYDSQVIEGIESLLFLSMTPLHSENPERQKYMLCRGSELFDRVFLS